MEVSTIGIYKMLRGGEVRKNWHENIFNVPAGSTLLFAEASISSFKNVHVQLFLIDGEAPNDMTEVVYEKPLSNIFGHINCGDAAAANKIIPCMGYEVKDKLYLAYWSHNMNWQSKDFHGQYTVYYK